jgi:hypothetical protein
MGDPDADAVARLGQEARPSERLFEGRDLAEARRVDGQVAVRRVRRDGEVRLANPHVDGLGANDDDGLAMRPECGQCIEKHLPRDHIELIHATPLRCRPSMR